MVSSDCGMSPKVYVAWEPKARRVPSVSSRELKVRRRQPSTPRKGLGAASDVQELCLVHSDAFGIRKPLV